MHIPNHVVFADEVLRGLTADGQKTLPTRYLYDDVGSALFDAITALDEYGLTRADIRLLNAHAGSIARLCPETSTIAELGSGNGSKMRPLMEAFGTRTSYRPIDLSCAALDACVREMSGYQVLPIHAEFIPGLETAARERRPGHMLAAFLGSNIGNFTRDAIVPFLRDVRARLHSGDALLLGADLIKPPEQLIPAYDDPAGVTAAFNRNLLSRINKQLKAEFDIRCFVHEARWNPAERRMEMHLRSLNEQFVWIESLGLEVHLAAGETIWTESSHKFEVEELVNMAQPAGFTIIEAWTDAEWPFAEMLFRA